MSERRGETRKYWIGFIAAFALTALAFLIVTMDVTYATKMVVIALMAILQVLVQLRYFLHIKLDGKSVDHIELLLFSTILLVIMIFGTIWVLGSLEDRMMIMDEMSHEGESHS